MLATTEKSSYIGTAKAKSLASPSRLIAKSAEALNRCAFFMPVFYGGLYIGVSTHRFSLGAVLLALYNLPPIYLAVYRWQSFKSQETTAVNNHLQAIYVHGLHPDISTKKTFATIEKSSYIGTAKAKSLASSDKLNFETSAKALNRSAFFVPMFFMVGCTVALRRTVSRFTVLSALYSLPPNYLTIFAWQFFKRNGNATVNTPLQAIYVHGLHPDAKPNKGELLTKTIGAISPNLPDVPQTAVNLLKALIQQHQRVMLFGHSLGGFYATYLAGLYNLNAVVTNPTVNPSEHPLLETVLDATPHLIPIIKQQLSEYDQPIKQPNKIWVILQKGDQLQDYQAAMDHYADCNQIIINDGSHKFNDFSDWLPTIKQLYSLQAQKLTAGLVGGAA